MAFNILDVMSYFVR